MYLLYIIGHAIAVTLPLKWSYWIACRIADLVFAIFTRDRAVVLKNMRIVLGESASQETIENSAREVFRNFAKYLVDFFRFSKVDPDYISRNVKVNGMRHIDEARSKGNGAVLLSAHIGNWELGAAVVGLIGYPLSGVVLPHGNKKINEFFTYQRRRVNMTPIEIGSYLRGCFRVLKDNGLLALLGDRDFTKTGIITKLFDQDVLIPIGPAALSCRLGSAIIPTFFIREPDDTFSLFIDEPIYPDKTADEDGLVVELTKRCTVAIEAYIKRYPTQWYVFKDIWNENGKDLRADTII